MVIKLNKLIGKKDESIDDNLNDNIDVDISESNVLDTTEDGEHLSDDSVKLGTDRREEVKVDKKEVQEVLEEVEKTPTTFSRDNDKQEVRFVPNEDAKRTLQ